MINQFKISLKTGKLKRSEDDGVPDAKPKATYTLDQESPRQMNEHGRLQIGDRNSREKRHYLSDREN